MVHVACMCRLSTSFHKEEVSLVFSLFPLIKQQVCLGVHTFQKRVLRWLKPLTTSLVLGTFADLIRGKAELLAENALLRQQLIILRRQIKRPMYKKTDRLLLVFLARMVRAWKQALFLIQQDDASSASTVSFSVCSGSRNPKRLQRNRCSRLRLLR
jgi:putative transposase